MKNNRKLLMVMLTVVLVILVACGSSDEQSTTPTELEINNVYQDKVSSEESENEEQNEVVDQAVNVEEKSIENTNPAAAEKIENEMNPSVTKETIQITSGEEAVQYLKQQLEKGTDDDISFGVDEKLRTDNNGSYYTIQLVSISTRVSGKTGNLGYYKVYQDGTYELLNSSNSDSGKAMGNKEEYLKKMNVIEEEIEELRKNSNATTTLDMELEEAERYKKWDMELNGIYEVLKEQLNTEQMDKLREEQRNWIKHRDKTAKEASLKYKGGSMESLEYVATQATLTKERCYELITKYMR